MTTITIGNLTLLPVVSDTTVIAAEDNNLTRKVSASSLKNYMSTITNLTASGNVTANVLQASFVGNATTKLYGTLMTNAQPFINSIGVLGNITVINTGTFGNVSANGSGVFNSVNVATLGTFSNVNSVSGYFGNIVTTYGIHWSNGAPYTASVTNFSGNLIPTANLTYNIGSPTAWWKDIYGVSIQAKYADLAENYTSIHNYSPGTVVAWNTTPEHSGELTMAQQIHTPLVAGVISTDPAYLMNSAAPGIPLALSGRVPCKVLGPVSKGDRLAVVAPGTAGRLDPALYQPGCVIGHALASVPDGELATIEVVIMKY